VRDFRLINHSRLQGSNLVDPICRRQNIYAAAKATASDPLCPPMGDHKWNLEPSRTDWNLLAGSRDIEKPRADSEASR
jgi:hypothetical protein